MTHAPMPGARRQRRVFEHSEAVGLLLIAIVVLVVTVIRYYLALRASTH